MPRASGTDPTSTRPRERTPLPPAAFGPDRGRLTRGNCGHAPDTTHRRGPGGLALAGRLRPAPRAERRDRDRPHDLRRAVPVVRHDGGHGRPRRERARRGRDLHDGLGRARRRVALRPHRLQHARLPDRRHGHAGVQAGRGRHAAAVRHHRDRRVPREDRPGARLHRHRPPARPRAPAAVPRPLARVAVGAAPPRRVLLADPPGRLPGEHHAHRGHARPRALGRLPRGGRLPHRRCAALAAAGPRRARARRRGRRARDARPARRRHARAHLQRRAAARADPRAQLVARARPPPPRHGARPHRHRRPAHPHAAGRRAPPHPRGDAALRGPEAPVEAAVRHRRVGHHAHRAEPRLPHPRDPHQGHELGRRLLQAGAHRPERRAVPHAQVPLHAHERRRGALRAARAAGHGGHPPVQGHGRPAHHEGRRRAPPLLARRAAAVPQRAARVHEPHRPAPAARGRGRALRQRRAPPPAHQARHVGPLAGLRPLLSWEDAIRLDLYYVENWSLTGDIIILARTFKAVFGADGAV